MEERLLLVERRDAKSGYKDVKSEIELKSSFFG